MLKRGNRLTLEQKQSPWYTCFFPVAVYIDARTGAQLVHFDHVSKADDVTTSYDWRRSIIRL